MNCSKPKVPPTYHTPRLTPLAKRPKRNECDNSVSDKQWPLFEAAIRVTVEIRSDAGIGAGVILSPEGLILTAYHVIEKSETIRVRRCRPDRRRRGIVTYANYLAEVVAEDRQADIALIILRRPPRNLPHCRLGTSRVLAVGSPLYRVGRDDIPLASGYLFEFGKEKGIPYFSSGMTNKPGASGGPVFDANGLLVGITVRGLWNDRKPPCSDAVPIDAIVRRLFRSRAACRMLGI